MGGLSQDDMISCHLRNPRRIRRGEEVTAEVCGDLSSTGEQAPGVQGIPRLCPLWVKGCSDPVGTF